MIKETIFNIGYDLILNEIPSGSKVLDLGCGNGELLAELRKRKNVDGYGIEISAEAVAHALERGVFVYHGDIDDDLSDYKDNLFDYVILNQTIQNTKKPDQVLREVMRIGRKAIVSFPNFSHFTLRASLFFLGTMPKTRALPYEWHDTPNIHMLTIKDFRRFCHDRGYVIERENHFSVSADGKTLRRCCFTNLRAIYRFFVIRSGK